MTETELSSNTITGVMVSLRVTVSLPSIISRARGLNSMRYFALILLPSMIGSLSFSPPYADFFIFVGSFWVTVAEEVGKLSSPTEGETVFWNL